MKTNKKSMDEEVKRLIKEVIGEDEIQKIASRLVDREPSSLRGEQHLFAIGRVSRHQEPRNSVIGSGSD